MTFLSARRLRGNLGWLIESSDFLMCTSIEQVSSFVPLKAPHVTHSYWDDITLAGLMDCKLDKQLMVIGSGMGSYLPALHHLAPSVHIRAIDLNNRFLEISRRVSDRLGYGGRLDIVEQDALIGIEQTKQTIGCAFIDLYSPEGILPLAGATELHAAIQTVLSPHGLVWINIADRLFESNYDTCPTKYFVDRISGLYRDRLLLRRRASTTAIFSNQPKEKWRPQLEAMMSKHYEIWPAHRVKILEIPASMDKTEHGVLEFSEQKAQAAESSDSSEGYMRHCLSEVKLLSQFDLIRLSRAPSALLGEWQ